MENQIDLLVACVNFISEVEEKKVSKDQYAAFRSRLLKQIHIMTGQEDDNEEKNG